jgi:hypothetical protein
MFEMPADLPVSLLSPSENSLEFAGRLFVNLAKRDLKFVIIMKKCCEILVKYMFSRGVGGLAQIPVPIHFFILNDF